MVWFCCVCWFECCYLVGSVHCLSHAFWFAVFWFSWTGFFVGVYMYCLFIVRRLFSVITLNCYVVCCWVFWVVFGFSGGLFLGFRDVCCSGCSGCDFRWRFGCGVLGALTFLR